MDAEEVEVISELRAIQFTIDKIVMSLKTLEEMTGPGGKLFTAQEEFAQSMGIWKELFKSSRSSLDDESE